MFVEPNVIIEITTSFVPGKRSTTELIGQDVLVPQLGIEPSSLA